jgi:hypothetical protein
MTDTPAITNSSAVEQWQSGRETDRMIADILGYHIYHYDKDVESRCYYQLWDESGDPAAFKTGKGLDWGQRKTPEEAWEDMPKWSTRDDHAMELTEYSRDFTLQKRGGLWVASFSPHMLFTGDEGFKHWEMSLVIAVNFILWARAGNYKKKQIGQSDD